MLIVVVVLLFTSNDCNGGNYDYNGSYNYNGSNYNNYKYNYWSMGQRDQEFNVHNHLHTGVQPCADQVFASGGSTSKVLPKRVYFWLRGVRFFRGDHCLATSTVFVERLCQCYNTFTTECLLDSPRDTPFVVCFLVAGPQHASFIECVRSAELGLLDGEGAPY